jgi:hypothetical protein
MSIIDTGEHKFVWVKKASQWCETWFEQSSNMGGKISKPVQKQKWYTEEEYAKFKADQN